MIHPETFLRWLTESGVDFFTGVPDSLLADFCATVARQAPHHVPAANEGCAIGLAAGHHLATGRVPCVYMQNSGLGNAVNPLLSLADPLVYGLPLLLIIGWRGEIDAGGAQLADEPQHRKQGLITPALCETMGLPHAVLDVGAADPAAVVAPLLARARNEGRPVALLVRKGAFAEAAPAGRDTLPPLPSREDAIAAILEACPGLPVVASTGKIAREVDAFRRRTGTAPGGDFLTVGSMGHASQIAAGIALARPQTPVVCLDGDGAFLMHMGGAVTAAAVPNVRHVVLDNGVHDSVGGQPTVAGPATDLAAIAAACGYRSVGRCASLAELRLALPQMWAATGSAFLHVRVRPGARSDLGRPMTSPAEARATFMRFLASSSSSTPSA